MSGKYDYYLCLRRVFLFDRVQQRRAWLFSKRPCVYRVWNGISHDAAGLAFVVQEMVDGTVSGVLFPNDPVTGDD